MGKTVTLILDGDVRLNDLARAIASFDELVAALSNDVAPGVSIDWVVAGLEYSSAVATAEGVGDDAAVDNVVRAYEKVGESLERGVTVPFSSKVRIPADSLTNLINGRVEAIRFETEQTEHLIRKTERSVEDATVRGMEPAQHGAVEGRIETLQHRRGLRFTLYDTLFDKAVSCYLAQDHENIMRRAWGRRASVFGRVRRDPNTGRPLSVRQVTKIEIIEEGDPDDWRQAIGAAPPLNDVSPEAAIRAMRDANE